MHDDIDLKAVRCFVALSEELNFSRAATRMAITQPSFSDRATAFRTFDEAGDDHISRTGSA